MYCALGLRVRGENYAFSPFQVEGYLARPHIFDLSVKKLSLLYETVVEIDERVTIPTSSEDPESLLSTDFESITNPLIVRGITGDIVHIIRRPDPTRIRVQLQSLHDSGFRSIAIAFLHSYTFPHHENLVADIARQMGFAVSVSSELQPMVKIVSRANSAIADAYLSPVTRTYIETFAGGFEGGIAALGDKLLFMRSDGGLCSVKTFSGLRAVLSGPAGGVIGYAKTVSILVVVWISITITLCSAMILRKEHLLFRSIWVALRMDSFVSLFQNTYV